jgi:tetratricopeptide (TPR) repeat protein
MTPPRRRARSVRSLAWLAWLGLALGVAAPPARADDLPTRSAKQHFARGEKLYALAKFSEALDEYQLAFDARPIPDFLFNIGQCYRNLGDYDSAVFSYRKYLRLAPDAPNREQVEQLIADLEAKQQANDSKRLGLQRDSRPPPPPPGQDAPIYKTWWFWTGAAVLGVAVGGGVVLYESRRTSGPPGTTLGNIVFGK